MEKLKDQFLENCHKNDLNGVTDCLSNGVDINTVSEYGDWSGITIAAIRNYPELLEILLSHPHIKINIKTFGCKDNICPWTALMFACTLGNSVIVSRLVQMSALDINYQDKNGCTATLLASIWGRTSCVKILAETGKVNWNKGDNGNGTPLYHALSSRYCDIVDIITEQPNIDYNVKTECGRTLVQIAVMCEECVKILASQKKCQCWNVPNNDGNTPVMIALKKNQTKIVEILLDCPLVDLKCRDKEGWCLLFRALERNKLDLVKMILSKLEKPYSGSSLARIAVEVGEEEDIKLLVQSGSVNWNEKVEDEDPAILWAIKNEKFKIVDNLMTVNKINLQGDPTANLTIIYGLQTFKVHKYFFCSKSPVFNAMLNFPWREAREGKINIRNINFNTLSSMIHHIYTGELTDDWQKLDIKDMAEAADFYDLPNWMELFCSKLKTDENVSSEKMVEMITVGNKYKHSKARELIVVARDKIKDLLNEKGGN